jgi:hypothetical protein
LFFSNFVKEPNLEPLLLKGMVIWNFFLKIWRIQVFRIGRQNQVFQLGKIWPEINESIRV